MCRMELYARVRPGDPRILDRGLVLLDRFCSAANMIVRAEDVFAPACFELPHDVSRLREISPNHGTGNPFGASGIAAGSGSGPANRRDVFVESQSKANCNTARNLIL